MDCCGSASHPLQMLILPPPTLPPMPGCVRELRIQGEEIVFHDVNLTTHGISHCPTCQDRPCQVSLPIPLPGYPGLSI